MNPNMVPIVGSLLIHQHAGDDQALEVLLDEHFAGLSDDQRQAVKTLVVIAVAIARCTSNDDDEWVQAFLRTLTDLGYRLNI